MTYNVAEIADLYGCHQNTVRNWLRLGLEAIDDGRPTLVKGDALNAFHTSRRSERKRPCGPGQLCCAPCHRPRRPDAGLVDCVPINPKVWKAVGICPVCGTLMTLRVGKVRLERLRAECDVTITKPPAQLEEAPIPNVNCDSNDKVMTR